MISTSLSVGCTYSLRAELMRQETAEMMVCPMIVIIGWLGGLVRRWVVFTITRKSREMHSPVAQSTFGHSEECWTPTETDKV